MNSGSEKAQAQYLPQPICCFGQFHYGRTRNYGWDSFDRHKVASGMFLKGRTYNVVEHALLNEHLLTLPTGIRHQKYKLDCPSQAEFKKASATGCKRLHNVYTTTDEQLFSSKPQCMWARPPEMVAKQNNQFWWVQEMLNLSQLKIYLLFRATYIDSDVTWAKPDEILMLKLILKSPGVLHYLIYLI